MRHVAMHDMYGAPVIVEPSNLCGGCTMCCKLPAIPELQKARSAWCSNCDEGKGCRIYDTRPEPCREFQCLWLDAQVVQTLDMPESLRPDKCKIVMQASTSGERIVLDVDPGFPNAYKSPAIGKFLAPFLAGGVEIIVAIGDRRRLITPRDDIEIEKA